MMNRKHRILTTQFLTSSTRYSSFRIHHSILELSNECNFQYYRAQNADGFRGAMKAS